MKSSGLSEFGSVLSDFRQLNSQAVKAVIAIPFADIWLKMGPPPSKAIGAVTALSEFLVMIWVFQFWYTEPENRLRIKMRAALILFVLCMVGSIFLLHTFSVSPGNGKERVIEGISVRPDVRPLLSDHYTPEDALRESAFDADQVWMRQSVVVMHLAIAAVWIASFASLAVFLNVFVILQRRTRYESTATSSPE
jgi:hypothetical protein